ncbi:MAG: hypothetical protein KAG66_13095, partial [Methylococcales bacterium]|nr:hypothetical protein [Methylococcales bacterium]
ISNNNEIFVYRDYISWNAGVTTQPGSQITIGFNVYAQNSRLTVDGGLVNRGELRLTNYIGYAYQSAITVTGGPLVNESTGLITSEGSTGSRYIYADLQNEGTVEVGFVLNLPVGPFVNRPAGIVTGNTTLALPSGGFSNAGHISPGLSLGNFPVSGDIPNTATGALDIEIGGLTTTLYDRLAVSGNLDLNGALNLYLANSYLPNIGDVFTIATATAVNNTFTYVTGQFIDAGHYFFVNYFPTEVQLEVGFPPNIPTDTLFASTNPGGTISPTGTIARPSGTDFTFSLSPNQGYHVSNLLVDGLPVGTPSSYTFTNLSQNHSIEAFFAIDTFIIMAS